MEGMWYGCGAGGGDRYQEIARLASIVQRPSVNPSGDFVPLFRVSYLSIYFILLASPTFISPNFYIFSIPVTFDIHHGTHFGDLSKIGAWATEVLSRIYKFLLTSTVSTTFVLLPVYYHFFRSFSLTTIIF